MTPRTRVHRAEPTPRRRAPGVLSGTRVAACALALGGLGVVVAALALDFGAGVHAAGHAGDADGARGAMLALRRPQTEGLRPGAALPSNALGRTDGPLRLGGSAGALGAAVVEVPRSVQSSSVDLGDEDGGQGESLRPSSGSGHTFGFEFHVRGGQRGDRPTDGTFVERFADGGLALEGGYRNGERDGDWTSYHPDGSVRLEGQYEAGRRVGRWRAFHPGGQLLGEGSFENHLREGLWVLYYTNGLVKERGVFEHDLRHGPWEFMDTFGQLEARSGYYRYGSRLTPF